MSDMTTKDLTMTVSRTIPASPARVYDAWLDPEKLARFMRPGDGITAPKVETDPRVGGRFLVLMRAGDQDIPHTGTYLELVPHKRIVFTWESLHTMEGSTVTLTLTPEGAGTHVTLRHDRFPDESKRDAHVGGWTGILAALTEVA